MIKNDDSHAPLRVQACPFATAGHDPEGARHGGAESSESHVRSSSCRPGRILRGRPTSVVGRKPSYPSRIRVERVAPPAKVLWPARCRITASGLRGQPKPAGPLGHGRRARDGDVCRGRGRNGLAWPACRVRPVCAMLVAPVVSTLGGSMAASRASR